jgi:hypothetical protein
VATAGAPASFFKPSAVFPEMGPFSFLPSASTGLGLANETGSAFFSAEAKKVSATFAAFASIGFSAAGAGLELFSFTTGPVSFFVPASFPINPNNRTVENTKIPV